MTDRPMTVPAPTGRVAFWDNARFVAIVLVVIGHAIQRLALDSDTAMALYLLIYAFHMPAFAIIAGYFSKSAPPTATQLKRVLTDLVVPYLIFETLWIVTTGLVRGRWNWDVTTASWTLWFLLALAIFRVVLPYLALLRAPLLWTVVFSIGIGYIASVDQTFSLARTFGLLPFFTLGWWLREHDMVARFRLLESRPWWLRAGAAAIFAGALWAAWAGLPLWREMRLARWLFYSRPYEALGAEMWWAGGIRLALIVIAVVLCAAFLVLIPRSERRWTSLGTATMYVYLLHTFVLYPLRESGVLRHLEPMWLWLPTMIVFAVLIAVALSSRPVRWLFRPLVEPRVPWLFTPSPASVTPRSG